MTPLQSATLSILSIATMAGLWRGARRRTGRWLLCLQAVAAVLLYCLFYPPHMPVRGDRLAVYTAPLMVALPEATSRGLREAAPDLATALRRHPGVRHLHIEGEGLAARDRPAAANLAVDFAPAPLRGLVELQLPQAVLLGHAWSLRGRVASPVTHVELRDPSGTVVDSSGVDAAGRFALTGTARGVGLLRFELRMLGPGESRDESASVPLSVSAGTTMTAILRAGAANPEFKYLRRWATDAGMQLSVSAVLTEGVALREGSTQLLSAALGRTDLVILDGRAWAALEPQEKFALRAAVDAGLGLLLRADGPLDATTGQDWRELGFDLQAAAPAAAAAPASTVTLDRRTGLHNGMTFSLAPLTVHAPEANVLLASDTNAPIAWWRAQGQGRVAMWLLLDSFKLVLGGETARYASLWSDTLEQLSRPLPAPPPAPHVPAYAWVEQRITLCGLGDAAGVRTPDGRRVALVIDAEGCAAYWPARAGWHVLETRGGDANFYVRATDDAAGLSRVIDRDATLGLVSDVMPPASAAPTLTETVPLPRWPLFAAWLLAISALWWCERRA